MLHPLRFCKRLAGILFASLVVWQDADLHPIASLVVWQDADLHHICILGRVARCRVASYLHPWSCGMRHICIHVASSAVRQEACWHPICIIDRAARCRFVSYLHPWSCGKMQICILFTSFVVWQDAILHTPRSHRASWRSTVAPQPDVGWCAPLRDHESVFLTSAPLAP
jgi:hypothetical protein